MVITIGFELENNIEISIAAALETQLTAVGYVWGSDDEEINVIEEWQYVDFSLPSMAMNITKNPENITSLGIDVEKNHSLVIIIFGRTGLERKQIAAFIARYFEDTDSVRLKDYNNDPITNDGWIHFTSVRWTPQVIARKKNKEDKEELEENVAVLTADVNVKRDI